MEVAAQLDASPIFIVGPLRSGSTLVRLVLQHHSQLNIFGEFEGAVSQAVGDQWPEIEKYYSFVNNDRQTSALNLSIDNSLDYKALVHSFLRQMSQRSPKPYIGACIHSRIDLLPKLWPQARYIHILRDPRDVARSAIGMGWVGNVHEGADYWIQPEKRWDILCQQVPEKQRFELQYEEFVKAPSTHCKALCDFLGLQFESEMLNIDKDTSYSKPDPAYSYQWKQRLTKKEINWVEYQCENLMLNRGYPLSDGPALQPSAWSRFLIKLQSRLARARFNIRRWGSWLWLQHVIAKKAGSPSWKAGIQAKINSINTKHLK